MAQSVARQWPALPNADPESLKNWADQITKLLQKGDIASTATIDALDDVFLTPAEGDAAYVNITGDTMTGLLTVQRDVSGNSSHINAVSADAGADFGPQIKLSRQSPSPAANDLIGRIPFQGKDSAGNDTIYAYLQARIDDPVNGSEDASVLLGRLVAGAEVTELIRTAGRETIWIPAAALVPRITGGPAAAKFETTTNVICYSTLNYDPTSTEISDFAIRMPKSWDEGTVTAQFIWSHAATVTNFGVTWRLSAVAISDDDSGDAALGTAQFSIDTGGTTDDIYISPETAAVTVGGSPASGDFVLFRFARIPSDGSDTLAVDARLHGVSLFYTTNAPNDL